jgi:hypothetical protein
LSPTAAATITTTMAKIMTTITRIIIIITTMATTAPTSVMQNFPCKADNLVRQLAKKLPDFKKLEISFPCSKMRLQPVELNP